MSRNATTSIKRPAPRSSSSGNGSRLGDLTRPIPIEKRISRRPKYALVAGLLALGVIVAAGVAVFVLPIGTWQEQDIDLVQRRAQLDELTRVNNELAAEVNRLGTDDGIREAARQDYGYVEVGEERSSILPFPELSTVLPDGWPYNAVTQIMNATSAGPRPAPVDPATSPTD